MYFKKKSCDGSQITCDTCKFYLQVKSIFYLATNTNGTLGGFFHHLYSIIYAFLFNAVRFEVIFERLTKTLQILKGFMAAIKDHILISSFSHAMHINVYLHMLCTKKKSIFDGSKDRLKTILIQFSKLQGRKPFLSPFLSPKNLNWTSLRLNCLNCASKCCSVHSLKCQWLLLFFLEK